MFYFCQMKNYKEIYRIFSPKTFSEKYTHIGYSYTNVPKGWEKIVRDTCIDIEKEMWPQKYLPFFIKRLIHYLATGNSVVRVKYDIFHKLRNKLTNNQIITDIKDKYAGLRIYGYYGKNIDKIIQNAEKECENTCENCSSTKNVTIKGKYWYYNLCEDCEIS